MPFWQDGPRCLARCIDALALHVDALVLADGPIAGVDLHGLEPETPLGPHLDAGLETHFLLRREWPSQADKFNACLELARRLGADWLLKVDADEILHNGDRLHDWLRCCHADAFPLQVYYDGLLEGGPSVIHACKLIRVNQWRRYVACNVLENRFGEYVRVVGDNDPDHHDAFEARAPFLDHQPQLREGVRATIRLSEIEEQIEPSLRDVTTRDWVFV